MADKTVIGVDIGGTKVAAGLVNASGEILYSARVPMNVHSTASAAMDCVHRAIREVIEGQNGAAASAIGVSSPGPLDPIGGLVLNAPNLPCWKNFPLRSEIQRAYGVPTRIDNDANAAGLAEALWGAARDCKYVLYVTIGTGIGTAIVLERSIYYGRTGAAAEGGHMTIDYRGALRCGCGKRGCIEGLASGPAIAALARERATADLSHGAGILTLAGGDPSAISTKTVFKAWSSGDALATQILDEVVEVLAVWFGNLIDMFEPEVIVMGGGVGTSLAPLFERIRERSQAWSVNPRAGEIPVLLAKYGVDAGLAGSAALWLKEPALNGAVALA
jgi:glucokinase